MPVIVSSGSSHTVVVGRQRTAQIVERRPAVRQVADRRTAATVEDRPSTVGVASPGPQGARGAPGGTSEARVAATTLGGHRMVRAESDGRVGYASSDIATHGDDTLGLTLGAALAGEAIDVQYRGVVTHAGWSWAPGEPVFLGRDGMPTQSVPDAGLGDAFIQVVGFAETATSLHLQIDSPIYL